MRPFLHLSRSTVLFVAITITSQASGQDSPGLDPQNVMVYDQYGNTEELGVLSVQDGLERGGGNSCVAGYFNLVFTDTPGSGFNDSDPVLAAQLREAACKVFSDLSVLIVPATNPYNGSSTIPLVNMEVSASGPWGPGEVGRGATWMSLVTSYMTDWPLQRGIIDGQVWRTINGGFDAWYAERIVINNPFQPTFFHGYTRINFGAFPATPAWWHVDGSMPSVAPPFDLYTVIAHEAMHALGFNSNISEFGGSQLFGLFYSRFDAHVQAPAGSGFLTSPWSCNNLLYTGADLTASCTAPPGPVVFTGANAGSLSLFSPDTWNQGGGSLDHLDFGCEGASLLMGPGNPPVVQNRIPSQAEVNVLCDIDYHTTNAYGTDPLWLGTVATGLDDCGHRLAGVDDIHPFGTTDFYVCPENGTLQINDFLLNDEDELASGGTPTDYECPVVLFPWGANSGTVAYVNSTTLQYDAAPNYVGLVILRYRPLCMSDGRHGSFTYIYLKVEPEEVCSVPNCNIVNGGDFESVTFEYSTFFNALTPYNDLQLPTDDPQYENNNSPDPIGWNGSNWYALQYAGGGSNVYCGLTPVPWPPSHSGLPNARYIGIAGQRDGLGTLINHESVMFNLCCELIPGEDYVLNFWAMDPCNVGLSAEFYILPERPCPAGVATTDVTGGVNLCGVTPFTVQATLSVPVSASGWSFYSVPFTFPAGAVASDWLVATVSLPLANGGQTYVLLDDVAIQPVLQVEGNGSTICTGTSTGSVVLTDISGGCGAYDILWSNSNTGSSITGLGGGTYDVTVTDELGCSVDASFDVVEEPCDPFTLTKTVAPMPTYAYAPVFFTIEACNTTANAEAVTFTEQFPAGFVMTGSTPSLSWPNVTVTLPAGGCETYVINGYFTAIGTDQNCVTLNPVGAGDDVQACVPTQILEGCPLVVYGDGGCVPGSTVDMCLGVHTIIPDVSAISYWIIYPDYMVPPAPGALTTPVITSPFSISSASIGVPETLSWPPGYMAAPVTVNFSPLAQVSPPYGFFCIDFTVGPGGVPAGVNTAWTWASAVSPNADPLLQHWNHVAITTAGSQAELWTQAYLIEFNGCPGLIMPDASFTIDQVLCTGEVSVTGTLTDPAAVHSWTWGDNRTTPTNGAPTYTYNYFSTITENQGWPVNPPIGPAPPGTYTITHTVILNGVASTSTQQVTVAPCCAAGTVIPHGSLASVVGTVFSGTIDVQGEFIVDDDVLFQNCQVYMEPGAEIIVQNGWTLDIDNASFTACNGVMWKSITAENGSTVLIRGSYMDDAESLVSALDGSVVWVDGTQFHNNRVGIGIPDVGGTYNNVACWVSNGTFYSAGTMPQPYQGQITAVGSKGFAAVDVHKTTLDFTGGNNIIHSLSNGIVAHRSDVTVSGCQMLNIKPDAAYAYVGNGAGIYANGSSSWSTLKQQGFGMNASPSFWDCRWGIYTEYMNVRSTDNRMVEMGTAYRVDRSGYRSVDILYNKVHTRFNGIDLRANDGAASLLVQYNDVTFGDTQCDLCRAYTGIFVSEGNYANPSSRILNNTIHFVPLAASRFGIGLTAADQWLVADNEVLMADNATSFTGIQLNGCRRTEVSCNTVIGANTSFPLDAQSAIRNMMGSDPLISCNVMDKTANGILFNGVAYNTDVRGNCFHNHKWPLHLDATAIIDAQTLKGNLWDPTAITPVWGAWYEVSNAQASLYKFYYNPAGIGCGGTQPPSWSPSSWFDTDPGQNYDCADHHGMDYCSQFEDDRCKECLRGLDEKIASDSLENNPYTEETKWILARDLYRKLDDAPGLLDSLPLLADFYADLQGSTTAAFKAIDDQQLALYDLDSTVVAQLQANRMQIEGLMALVKDGLEQLADSTLTPAQRQTIHAGISGYRQAVRGLSDWNATALQVAQSSKVLTAEGVKAANGGVVTSELIEANEKAVNDNYLATVGKDVDAFTSVQTAELFDIANQCPMLGGNAVFKARSLYWLIDDSYDFDDQLLCLPHGIIVKSLVEHDPNELRVVPNPANDEATLVLDRALDEPGVFVVFNAMGAEVMRYTVPIERQRITFSTASLAPALYHYQVRGPSRVIGHGKLTIVR